MRALLFEAATGETALEKSPDALVFRLENTYEEGGELFWVNARAKWSEGYYPITTKEAGQTQTNYNLQAYLVHRRAPSAGVAQGMRSGHYVAYFRCKRKWYRADDERVTLLSKAPTEYPYLVFLTRIQGRERHLRIRKILEKRAARIRKMLEKRAGCKILEKRAGRIRKILKFFRRCRLPALGGQCGIREGASARRPGGLPEGLEVAAWLGARIAADDTVQATVCSASRQGE